MGKILEINNISKKYGTKLVLDNINIDVNKSEIVAILGINGAGKTTLIKILSGFIRADKIEKIIFDESNISVVFGGDNGFYMQATAYENLKLFGVISGLKNNMLKSEIERCLKLVELYEQKDNLVATYSKGMKQRLHIARGLLGNKKIILLDEPTIGIDIDVAKNIRTLVYQMKESGISFILTSHAMKDIEVMADRILILNNNKIIFNGSKNELKSMGLKITKSEVDLENAYLALLKNENE